MLKDAQCARQRPDEAIIGAKSPNNAHAHRCRKERFVVMRFYLNVHGHLAQVTRRRLL